MMEEDIIRRIEEMEDISRFTRCFVTAIILTSNREFLLQQRGKDWKSFPGKLSAFGGRMGGGETPLETLCRELNEELGANVMDAVYLGAYTEKATDYTELVHAYFWHDKEGTITGCYEGEPAYFDEIEDILKQPNLMDDVPWLLVQCRNKGLT